MLSAANGQTYGGGFKVAPKASVTDGLLDIITVKKISLFNRLKYLPVIEKGRHLDRSIPFVHYEQTNELVIQSDHLLQAHLDGDIAEQIFD
jgi:diacylglycerol kinase family enzyme